MGLVGSCHRIGVVSLLALGLVQLPTAFVSADAGPGAAHAAASDGQAQAEVVPAARDLPWPGRLPLDGDPLGLARYVDRAGDDALLAAMTPDQSALKRCLAFRGAPFMRAPELALPLLVKAMAGSDPDLAPEAARAAFAIVQGLVPDGLLERGAVEPDALRALVTELEGVSSAARTRPDIAVRAASAAAVLSDQLTQAGVVGSSQGDDEDTQDHEAEG